MSLLAAALLAVSVARGATLPAGVGTAFPQPSAAIAAAAAGDTVTVAPGTYYDCAAWQTDGLTVEGQGAVFSDRACEGKAAFVIRGDGTVLRGLVFAHVRVADGNGAGVRLEGGSLTVEDCVFDDDQAAVLAAGRPEAALVLRRVSARRVGVPGSALAAVTVSGMAGITVEDSSFADGRGDGGALRSEAPAVVSGSAFAYGAGANPVIDVSAPVTAVGDSFRLFGRRPAAIRAAGAGAVVRGTRLEDGGGGLLLQDWTGEAPEVSGNTVGPSDAEVSSSGRMGYWAKTTAHAAAGGLRHLAGRVWRAMP